LDSVAGIVFHTQRGGGGVPREAAATELWDSC